MSWLHPDIHTADAVTKRTAQLVVTFALSTVAVDFAFIVVSYVLAGATAATFMAVMAPFIASGALIVRFTPAVAIAAQGYLVSVWMLITGFALLVGDVITPSFPTYALLILGATFLVGRRSGIVWTAISVVTVVAVWFVRTNWHQTPTIDLDKWRLFYMLAINAVLVLSCFFALQYDRVKNHALDELKRANDRTSAMITRLEQASQRLVVSSQRFLGSGQDVDRGLVGEMLHKARGGRTAIEESRSSIAGMIDQYRHIAQRVQELYEHSKGIVDLVATIDRISDRLDLMALNVGIEASHGGEEGRQFTILANDMRQLAERVLNETMQIKHALRQVQSRVQEVLESSTSGQALTEESVDKMNAMALAFDDIYALIEEAEGAAGQITADTLAQINAVRKLVTVAWAEGGSAT